MSLAGRAPIFENDTVKMYIHETTSSMDQKETWFGQLSLKVGNYWKFGDGTITDSKEKAIRNLHRLHVEASSCAKPQYDIEELIKELL